MYFSLFVLIYYHHQELLTYPCAKNAIPDRDVDDDDAAAVADDDAYNDDDDADDADDDFNEADIDNDDDDDDDNNDDDVGCGLGRRASAPMLIILRLDTPFLSSSS